MAKINNIQKVNLELKNYINRIKSQNVLDTSTEKTKVSPNLPLLENNQVKFENINKSTNSSVRVEGDVKLTSPAGESNNTIQLNRQVSVNSIQNPIFLISQKIHRHIKSLINFNSELAKNNTLVFNFNNFYLIIFNYIK